MKHEVTVGFVREWTGEIQHAVVVLDRENNRTFYVNVPVDYFKFVDGLQFQHESTILEEAYVVDDILIVF